MRPRRVLVIAADAAIRRHLRDNFYVSGYSVFEAGDQRAALEATEDFSPDAVLIDFRGSTMTDNSAGMLTVDLITAILETAAVRPHVAAITGAPGMVQPSAAIAAGADDYLVSPFCIGELLVRVDRLLGVALPPPRNEIRPREQPRLSDLVEKAEHSTLIWITLGGVEQLDGVGIDGHAAVSSAVSPVISEAIPDGKSYWAGTERIAVIGPAVRSGSELSAELTANIEAAIARLSLPIELKLRIRSGIRAWKEGKATFLARVTGRLSHGGLPTVPLGEGKPAVGTVEAARSRLGTQLVSREFGGLLKRD